MPSSQTKKNIPYKYLSLKIYLKCIRIDGHVLILRSWKWRWSLFFSLSPENVAHVKTRCRKNPRVLILLICSIFSFILPFISFIVTLELGIITIPISRPPLWVRSWTEKKGRLRRMRYQIQSHTAENSTSVLPLQTMFVGQKLLSKWLLN